MTACKDSQATSGKKAVSATLAGVLAVGMVPAVALADEAVEVTEEDGITELTATIGQEFNGGTISKINLNGTVQATPSKIEITVGTTGLNVAPTQLTSKTTGATLDLLKEDGSLKDGLTLVYTNTKDNTTASTCPAVAGTYTVQVTGADTYAGLTSAPLSFSIVSKSLQGATLYEAKFDPNDISDTTFNFTGAAQTFGVALGGAPLDLTPSTGDVTVTYRNAAGNTVVAPEDAGSYIAVVSGANDYAGSEVQIPFTIGTFNLTAADIKLGAVELTPGTDAAASIVSINGVPKGTAPASTLIPDLEFSYPVVPTKIGSYTTTVSAVDAEKDNIVGAKTLSYDVVTSTDAVFKYNSSSLADLAKAPIDLSAGESFDLSKLEVSDKAGTQLTSGQYAVTVTDADGRPASVADLNRAGTWNLTVTVNAAAMNYALGGSETVTVSVSNGTVEGADMFVSYKGVTSNEFDEPYTGQNMLADVAVKVVAGDKTLAEGVDYKVAYTNSKGATVTEFVNADTYKITITSDTWNITTTSGANVCEFTISPIEIKSTDVQPAGVKTIVTQKGDPTATPPVVPTTETGIAYTGSAITPTFEYKTSEKDAEGNDIYAMLPADTYKITKITNTTGGASDVVDQMIEPGTYKVELTQNADQDNYTWASPFEVEVRVIKGGLFLDVPTDAWYAEPISKIAAEGIMNGYAGSKFFGPNDTMIRGMVACSFFNMAGGAERYPNNWENGEGGFVTPFDDVVSTMYYAQAIAWAADAKVMNGIGGTDSFDPNGAITREQLVAVICNYAKKSGEDVSADVADLDKFPDAGEVSGWAKDVVAWGVSKGIVGNGGVLNPQGQATRAEVAAMIANYLGL